MIRKKEGNTMKRDANPEKGLEALDQCEYMVLAMTLSLIHI